MVPVTQQKASGVYYTPRPVVDYIVRQTLDPLLAGAGCLRRPRVLDPACGDGAFLRQAYRHLRASSGEASSIMADQLFGVDVDRQAVLAARRSLRQLADEAGAAPSAPDWRRLAAKLRGNIRCGDALIGPDFLAAESQEQGGPPQTPIRPLCWKTAFRRVLAAGGFDAVVGNPPYVNIRVLTRTRGADVKRYLQTQFRCAQRAYDLYVLFLEQALALLRPGGICGMIVPNKIATLDYALPCRALLLEQTTLREVTDASQLRIFPDAGVYPYILIFQKRPPTAEHRAQVRCVHSIDDLAHPQPLRPVRQRDLSAESGFQIHGQLDVENRVPTLPLGDRATLHSGTTGFVAQRIASALREECDVADEPCFDFIVSGNIDRFVIRRGRVRFMKRDYRRPVLSVDAAELTEGKRRLFGGPKIVLAGMSRRLEAALDERGVALGVQVYAATDTREDPRFLLGLLNSKLLSYLFGIRYRAKRLAGGYLAVNKGQLARLPIRLIEENDERETQLRARLVEYVDRMQVLCGEGHRTGAPTGQARRDLQGEVHGMDNAIDRLVYELYDLTDAEIARVEADFDQPAHLAGLPAAG